MIHVRRHKRTTASGKTVSVTAHERQGGGGRSGEIVRPAPEWSRPEYVGDITPVADKRGTSPEFRAMFLEDDGIEEDIWAEGDAAQAPAEPEMSPAFAAFMAQSRDPGEMERFRQLKVMRDAGYDGPVDQDGLPADRKAFTKVISAAKRKADRAPDRDSRREAKARLRQLQEIDRVQWERDMRADAERKGLPAYRPLGTKAEWWRER